MAKKQTTALSTNAIPNAIAKLEEKLKSFEGINESAYLTGGEIEGFHNLKEVADLKQLIKMAGTLVDSKRIYDSGAAGLNLETFPMYEYKGFSVESWLKDIRLRYDLINQKETIDRMNEFKAELAQFLSDEDRKAIVLEKLKDFMGE